MYDEFDRANRPPLMSAAEQRVAELRGVADDTPAPRRPPSIYGPRKAPAWLVPALVLGTAAALYLLFTSAAPPAPLAVPAAAPTAAWAAPGEAPPPAAPLDAPAPTAAPAEPAGIGTGEGFIEPLAPPQAAPAGVGGQAPQFVNPEPVVSDLVPLEEAPGWHPPLEAGQPAPTPNNFVEVRP